MERSEAKLGMLKGKLVNRPSNFSSDFNFHICPFKKELFHAIKNSWDIQHCFFQKKVYLDYKRMETSNT